MNWDCGANTTIADDDGGRAWLAAKVRRPPPFIWPLPLLKLIDSRIFFRIMNVSLEFRKMDKAQAAAFNNGGDFYPSIGAKCQEMNAPKHKPPAEVFHGREYRPIKSTTYHLIKFQRQQHSSLLFPPIISSLHFSEYLIKCISRSEVGK